MTRIPRLLILPAVIASVMMGCVFSDGRGVDVDPRFQYTAELNPENRELIFVDWANGDIEVNADDGSKVRLTAVGWRGGSPLEPEEWLERLDFELEEGRLLCRYNHDLLETISVSLRLLVPTGLNLEVDTSNGDVDVAGVGELSVDSSNGDLLVRDVDGPVSADTSNGEIEIGTTGELNGDIHCDTSNGSIKIQIGGDHHGIVELDSSNGGLVLRVEGNQYGDAVLDSTNGSITIEYGGFSGTTSADTGNGGIDVLLDYVPEGLAVDASTSNGTLSCDISGVELRTDSMGGELTLIGDGPRLELDTMNGEIDLRLTKNAE